MSETKCAYNATNTDLIPGARFGYKVIAVVGGANDWAAYLGLTSQTDDEVARNGDKISKDAAEALFPIFKWSEFRYRGN